jgi:hypothetical protein
MFKTIQVLMWKHQSTLHWVRFVCFLCCVIGITLYSKKPLPIFIVRNITWHITLFIFYSIIECMGYAVAQLVEALRYKPIGRGFDSRWCLWNFSLT